MGIPFPEKYGGAGGDTLAYALCVEELARVDSSVAITLCAHTSLGTQPIYLFGSDEQQQGVDAAAVRRRDPRRVRADRGRGRLGRREHEDARAPGGRRVGDRRLQAVHHERRHGDLGPRDDHGADRRGRDLELPRAQRHARLRAGRAVSQDGLARLRHAPADLRRLPRARGQPARSARQRPAPVPARAGDRPHRRRRDGPRPRAGRVRRGAGLRQAAPRVRPRDLRRFRRSRSSSPTWRRRSRRRACSSTAPRC